MNKRGHSPSKKGEEHEAKAVDPGAKEQTRKWVRQAKAGDEAAFGELVKTYHQRLYSVVYRFARNEDDANELAQQTWVKAWNKLHTFKGRSEFFTWLYRIATYVGLDHVRKQKRRREDELLEGVEPLRDHGAETPFSTNPQPDRAAEHDEIRERFNLALEDLSAEHRMALVLREVEGLSYDEIARAMKCRKGTVMSRLYYARKKLAGNDEGPVMRRSTAEKWLSRG